jgi:Na+/proline symporter
MLVTKIFPLGVAGLILAGMLSAFMSIGDITLPSAATLRVNDVIAPLTKLARKSLRLLRTLVFVLGAFMIIAVVAISKVPVVLDIAYLYLTAGLFIPAVVRPYWKGPHLWLRNY